MSRAKTEIRLAAIGKLIVERAGNKRRSGPLGQCYVPWRYLDQLADAVRATGIAVDAPNLGEEAHAKAAADQERRRAGMSSWVRGEGQLEQEGEES